MTPSDPGGPTTFDPGGPTPSDPGGPTAARPVAPASPSSWRDERPPPPARPTVSLGFPPIDHASPDTDDVARRTNRRTILAHIFTTLVAGIYAIARVELELRQSSDAPDLPVNWVVLGVVPFVVGHFLIEVLRWRAFTFRVNSHRLVIDKGIFTRHHIVVPFDRVQQVDLHRRFTAIVLGLASVRIDTAGMGEHTSVELRYLDPHTANGLRAFILQHREVRSADAAGRDPTTNGAVSTPAPTEHPLLALGPARLVQASLTHHTLLVLLPVLIGLFLWTMTVVSLTSNRPVEAAFYVFVALTMGATFLLALTQSLIGTVVRQWGFTLSHTGDDLHLRFGLTNQRHLTVPRRRIQHIEVIDNPVRRAFGLVSVHLHSAASVAGAGPSHRATRFEIPAVRRAELTDLLPRLVGDPHFHIPELTPRPDAARRRAMLRRTAVLALALSGPAVAARPFGLALFGLALLGIPWGRAAHRRAGHASTPAVAVLAHGVLQHRVVLVPLARLQSARTTSTPFQRRVNVSTLHLDVARALRAPMLFDMDAAAADHFRHDLPATTAPTAVPVRADPGRDAASPGSPANAANGVG